MITPDYCSCIYVDDYDAPEFYNARIVRAKKDHWCCECRKTINVGDRYEYVSGCWDSNGISIFKTCLTCIEIRKALFCAGWMHENLYETIVEHLEEIHPDVPWEKIGTLSPVARNVLLGMVEDTW